MSGESTQPTSPSLWVRDLSRRVWEMSSRVLPSADLGTRSGHRGRKRLLGLGMGSAGGVFANLANQRAQDFVRDPKSKIKWKVREDANFHR